VLLITKGFHVYTKFIADKRRFRERRLLEKRQWNEIQGWRGRDWQGARKAGMKSCSSMGFFAYPRKNPHSSKKPLKFQEAVNWEVPLLGTVPVRR
jgi:hypothetical protein